MHGDDLIENLGYACTCYAVLYISTTKNSSTNNNNNYFRVLDKLVKVSIFIKKKKKNLIFGQKDQSLTTFIARSET